MPRRCVDPVSGTRYRGIPRHRGIPRYRATRRFWGKPRYLCIPRPANETRGASLHEPQLRRSIQSHSPRARHEDAGRRLPNPLPEKITLGAGARPPAAFENAAHEAVRAVSCPDDCHLVARKRRSTHRAQACKRASMAVRVWQADDGQNRYHQRRVHRAEQGVHLLQLQTVGLWNKCINKTECNRQAASVEEKCAIDIPALHLQRNDVGDQEVCRPLRADRCRHGFLLDTHGEDFTRVDPWHTSPCHSERGHVETDARQQAPAHGGPVWRILGRTADIVREHGRERHEQEHGGCAAQQQKPSAQPVDHQHHHNGADKVE
mmetsp:Transcript_57305/g.145303  ORF Transcript_57305/g.145303 Transcript_57305/m.145303 type:complete len:319 (-) Transcript_57305:239-1195(-)